MTKKIVECPLCESRDVVVRGVNLRHAFGLPSLTLLNVQRIECNDCGEAFSEIPTHGALMRQIRYRLCYLGRIFRGTEFAFLRASLNYSQTFIGELMDVSNVTVSRWENDRSSISAQTDTVIRLLTLESMSCEYSIDEIVSARNSARRTFEIDVEKVDGQLPSVAIMQTLTHAPERIWPLTVIRPAA